MFNKILEQFKKGHNLFITGGGGVGKSYTLNKLRELCLSMVVTSSTGISAVNIQGQTLHSWCGMGVGQLPIKRCIDIVSNNDEKASAIKSCSVLAIDEISMLNSMTLDYVNQLLQGVRGNKKPFGGIQVLLFGDFFQLPPVKLGDLQEVGCIKGKIDYCFNSLVWPKLKLKTINLTKVYRQTDSTFISALNNVRQGIIKDEDMKLFYSRNNLNPPEECVRLYAANKESDNYNLFKYNKIKQKEFTFFSSDRYIVKNEDKNPWKDKLTKTQKKLFEEFDKNCKAKRIINLKVGCRVMLLHNLNIDSGLCNGSCGYVTELRDNGVLVKFDNGIEEFIKKAKFQIHSKGELLIERKQIPLCLAYSITCHKSQGMSLDKVFIDMSKIFTSGQCYVALSRARTLDGLYLRNFSKSKIMTDNRIKDFYKNIK